MSVIFFPSTVFDCHYSIKCSMFFDDDIVVIEKKKENTQMLVIGLPGFANSLRDLQHSIAKV